MDKEEEGKMDEITLTLSVSQCAKVLGIGRNLCYEKVKTGEIPCWTIGRRKLIPKSALNAMLENPKGQDPVK